MKYLFVILFLFFCVSLTSAVTIYSGEPIEIELEQPYSYYSVVGNSTEIILNITQNGNNVTIILDKYSESDSFEIVFFNIEKEIVVEYYNSCGGGSSGTSVIYKDRNLTEYVDKEVVKYVDKEVEVEVGVEKIIKDIPTGVLVVLIILMILIVVEFILYMNERRYRKNE